MRVTFDLPRSFDPTEYLTGPLALKADYGRWLVSAVLRKMALGGRDEWGLARLHSDVLYRVLGNGAGKIVQALETGQVIETTPYRGGVKTRGYRLALRFLDDRCVRVPCTNPVLRERLLRERERMESAAEAARTRWLPIHHTLNAEQHALSIDGRLADEILDTLPAHTTLCQSVLVADLRRRAFRFSVGSTGRVFNAISSLKRELRGAVRLAGEPTGCVDLVNSQPALLAVEMLLQNPTNGVKGAETYRDTGADSLPSLPCSALPFVPASLFPSLALNGHLYEFLAQRTGLSRDVVKLALLRDVLAKKGRYPSQVENVFRREFPEVYAFVRRINHHDHAELIRLLQRRESWLVIHQVTPRLIGRVPVVTLHDAVYSKVDKLPMVETAFNDTFDAIGFRMSLKREVPSERGAMI